jgi:alkylresorcinol/alkylpyrone synthase
MEPVRIVTAAVAHPPNCVSQAEAARLIGELSGDPRRVAAIARGTRIASRRTILPPAELAALGGIEDRNRVYQGSVGQLGLEAARGALGEAPRDAVSCLVTSSCTGYSVPGWGVSLVQQLGLGLDTARLPITEAGCAGGVVALAHAAEYLRTRPGRQALAVAVELCSLSFHASGDDGNLTSTLVFGDGAGSCLLESGPGPGLGILDSLTALIPNTREALGFDLTGRGFYPVLTRELTTLLPPALRDATARLLHRNNVTQDQVGAWLHHPGGARILSGIEAELALARSCTRWSWESMAQFGNTSSAAIFDVIRRYLEEPPQPGLAVIAAFGPGVSIELLLVERRC